MRLAIADPELFGVSESSLSLSFRVEDGDGAVDAPARIRIDGEVRAVSEGPAATRWVRVEGLARGRRHRVDVEVDGADPPARGPYFPESVETLAAPEAAEVGSLATLNDLHFGEPRFGGIPLEDGDFGDEAPGFPTVLESEGDVPYWQFMNEDAIAEINALRPDRVLIKGDVADAGLPEQFGFAAAAFASFEMPHDVILGNHDYYALGAGLRVDGYALLEQPEAPRRLDLGGWRLILLDSVEPGAHHGRLDGERLDWLGRELDQTREPRVPTLVFMHHQPVPPEFADRFPNTIGIPPRDSLGLFGLLGRHPQVRAVLVGHTHRNRVRTHRAAPGLPIVEVASSKDYPGVYAHYRLHEDGGFIQEVRRTGSPRALAHSTRCSHFFRGGYRHFALGPLASRSFVRLGDLPDR